MSEERKTTRPAMPARDGVVLHAEPLRGDPELVAAVEAHLNEAMAPGKRSDGEPECTGISARWCPRCGDCTCGPWPEDDPDEWDIHHDGCPLHGLSSTHAGGEIDPRRAAALRGLDAVTRERDEAHVVAARLRDDLAILAADIAAHREAIEEARAEAELLRRELAEARADRDALKGALSRANELRIGDRAEARLDERWACSEFAEKWLREVDEITQDTPADLADAIRARGNGGAP